MAREYGKTWFSMFTDEDFTNQPRIDKLLYIVLLSQPALNYAGVQPINLKRWRKALREADVMPTELEVKASLIRQERRGYVFTDDDTGETLVRSFIRRDQIDTQPNVMLSALRSAAAIESPKLAGVLLLELGRIPLPEINSDKPSADRLRENLKRLNADARTHLETLSEGLPEDLPEPFAEDFPKGLPEGFTEPFPRPGEIEPLSEPFAEGFPEGFGEPPVVVEVEVGSSPPVGGYVGGTRARDAETGQAAAGHDQNDPPPNRCPRHINRTDDPPCRDCRAARERRELWDADQTETETRRLAAFWADVRACPDCDDHGLVEHGNYVGRCRNHDWEAINA